MAMGSGVLAPPTWLLLKKGSKLWRSACECNLEVKVYFSLGEVLALLVFGAASVFFLSAIRVRELALQHVTRASRRDDFQLLDQSVHIQRLSLSRDEGGRWRIWRQYRFDYSFDGVQRRQGHVIMLGKTLLAVVVSEQPRVLH